MGSMPSAASRPGDALGVVLVHLAPEGAHVEAARRLAGPAREQLTRRPSVGSGGPRAARRGDRCTATQDVQRGTDGTQDGAARSGAPRPICCGAGPRRRRGVGRYGTDRAPNAAPDRSAAARVPSRASVAWSRPRRGRPHRRRWSRAPSASGSTLLAGADHRRRARPARAPGDARRSVDARAQRRRPRLPASITHSTRSRCAGCCSARCRAPLVGRVIVRLGSRSTAARGRRRRRSRWSASLASVVTPPIRIDARSAPRSRGSCRSRPGPRRVGRRPTASALLRPAPRRLDRVAPTLRRDLALIGVLSLTRSHRIAERRDGSADPARPRRCVPGRCSPAFWVSRHLARSSSTRWLDATPSDRSCCRRSRARARDRQRRSRSAGADRRARVRRARAATLTTRLHAEIATVRHRRVDATRPHGTMLESIAVHHSRAVHDERGTARRRCAASALPQARWRSALGRRMRCSSAKALACRTGSGSRSDVPRRVRAPSHDPAARRLRADRGPRSSRSSHSAAVDPVSAPIELEAATSYPASWRSRLGLHAVAVNFGCTHHGVPCW